VPRVDRDKDPLAEQLELGRKVEGGRVQLHEQFQSERKRLLARQSKLEETLVETRTGAAFLAARARVASYEGLVSAIHALFRWWGCSWSSRPLCCWDADSASPLGARPHFSAAAACAGLLIILGTIAFSGRPGEKAMAARARSPAPKKEEAEPRKKEDQKQVASASEAKRELGAEDNQRSKPTANREPARTASRRRTKTPR